MEANLFIKVLLILGIFGMVMFTGCCPRGESYRATFMPGEESEGPFCPPWIEGNRRLGKLADITARATLYIVDEREVWAEINYKVREPDDDHSTADGTWDIRLYKVKSNEKITSLITEPESFIEFTDRDNQVNQISPREGPVNTFNCIGLTKGRDIGGDCESNPDRSNLTINWKSIEIEVECTAFI